MVEIERSLTLCPLWLSSGFVSFIGMLGLDDLVYYAKYYPQSSKHALECSHDEVSWYSFAIVGINITAFAVQTLRTRQLQYYLFLNGTDRSVYHELYCNVLLQETLSMKKNYCYKKTCFTNGTFMFLLFDKIRLPLPPFQWILDDTGAKAEYHGFRARVCRVQDYDGAAVGAAQVDDVAF